MEEVQPFFEGLDFVCANAASGAEAAIRLGDLGPDGRARQFSAVAERGGSTDRVRPGRGRVSADGPSNAGSVAPASLGYLAAYPGGIRQAAGSNFWWHPVDCGRACLGTAISRGERDSFESVSGRSTSWGADRGTTVGRRAIRGSGTGSAGGERYAYPLVLGSAQSVGGACAGMLPCGQLGIPVVSGGALAVPAFDLQ